MKKDTDKQKIMRSTYLRDRVNPENVYQGPINRHYESLPTYLVVDHRGLSMVTYTKMSLERLKEKYKSVRPIKLR